MLTRNTHSLIKAVQNKQILIFDTWFLEKWSVSEEEF